jgi:hypothetical protein
VPNREVIGAFWGINSGVESRQGKNEAKQARLWQVVTSLQENMTELWDRETKGFLR